MRHDAIVVTSSDRDLLKKAYDKAVLCACAVTDIVASPVNGYATFCVVPDGSKEGWPDSDTGYDARETFIAWLRDNRYEDGSTSLEWAAVSYGSDDRRAYVTSHAWQRQGAQP
jgi:hypothetical protein